MLRIVKILLPLLVLALGAGGFYYFKNSKQQVEPIKRPIRLPVVSAMLVEKQSVSPTLTLFGQVEAPSNSVLSAAVSADVIEVSALEGSAVEKGQVLIKLDDIDANLEILQRRAERIEIEAQIESDKNRYAADKAALGREKSLLALSRKAVERSKTLARSQAGTEVTLDNALQQEQQQLLAITLRQQSIDDFSSRQKQFKARLDKAAAALKRSQRDLERTIIVAPYSGRVINVMVSPGDRTNTGTQLLQLYDDSRLELRTQIPSRYVPELQQVIDRAEQLDAIAGENGEAIKLTLNRLSARVSQGQGGVDAFFGAPEGGLPALGKTLELKLTLPVQDNVVVLSTDSLYGANKVYRIENGTLRGVAVKRIGQRFDAEGRQQLIVDGAAFEDGDTILDSRLPQAIDGLQVEVRLQPSS